MATYQCFTPLPSALPLPLLSLCELSHGGFVLKQVRSLAVDSPPEQTLQWVRPAGPWTKLSAVPLYHDLMRLVNKGWRITREREERMGRRLVLCRIHKQPSKKVWVSHSLNVVLHRWWCAHFRGKQSNTLIWSEEEAKILSGVLLNSLCCCLHMAEAPQGGSRHVLRAKRAMTVSSSTVSYLTGLCNHPETLNLEKKWTTSVSVCLNFLCLNLFVWLSLSLV